MRNGNLIRKLFPVQIISLLGSVLCSRGWVATDDDRWKPGIVVNIDFSPSGCGWWCKWTVSGNWSRMRGAGTSNSSSKASTNRSPSCNRYNKRMQIHSSDYNRPILSQPSICSLWSGSDEQGSGWTTAYRMMLLSCNLVVCRYWFDTRWLRRKMEGIVRVN